MFWNEPVIGMNRKYIIIVSILILSLFSANTGLASSFGVEYDSSGGLGVNTDSANSFANRMVADGWQKKFFFGNCGSWEKDFRDVTKGGLDNYYADAVDLTFWEGHGSPSGIYFPCPDTCACRDDNYATYDDIRLGDLNCEWFAAHSCSVLADDHLSDWAYKACANGLHMMCSHATTVYACNAGDKFAQYLIAGRTVKDAWFQQHLDLQPTGVTAKVICTPDTANDHIWGHGSVAADTVPGQTWWQYWLTK
jgi:hypothetical protein